MTDELITQAQTRIAAAYSPALLRERVADLIEEQIDAVVSLPAAQHQIFLGRGGAAFLQQAASFAPGARQPRLQALLAQLRRARG